MPGGETTWLKGKALHFNADAEQWQDPSNLTRAATSARSGQPIDQIPRDAVQRKPFLSRDIWAVETKYAVCCSHGEECGGTACQYWKVNSGLQEWTREHPFLKRISRHANDPDIQDTSVVKEVGTAFRSAEIIEDGDHTSRLSVRPVQVLLNNHFSARKTQGSLCRSDDCFRSRRPLRRLCMTRQSAIGKFNRVPFVCQDVLRSSPTYQTHWQRHGGWVSSCSLSNNDRRHLCKESRNHGFTMCATTQPQFAVTSLADPSELALSSSDDGDSP